jgi:hypothetical protein
MAAAWGIGSVVAVALLALALRVAHWLDRRATGAAPPVG